jgi:hypothetical protein
VSVKIQLKRATAAAWTAANPTLSSGEIGYETDTAKFKIGNGSTAWISLVYSNANLGSASLDALSDVTITSAANGDFLRWNGTAWVNVAASTVGATTLDGLSDVVVTTPTATQLLKYDGTNWVNSANFTGYDHEIHVSQVDGNDTTGNGDLLTPVASITKALTLVTSQRKTVIVHPGTYTESPSITTQYTTITGPGLIGGNIVISGTVSTNTGCTVSGIKMTNLTVTTPAGQGNVNVLNCEVSGTFTKSSNADYTVARLCDFGTTSITGAGLVAIFGGNPNFVTVNNASANVIVKSAVTVSPVLTAGTLNLVDSVVGAAVTNAVTSAASSVITLVNCQFLTSNLSGVAPVVLNGFYSILNCVYDKPSSTLVATSGTGGSTNSIDYFQYINADKFITQGGTSGQFVKGDGSLSSVIGSIDDLSDVVITSASTGQVLKWNGSAWVNSTDNAGTTIASIDDISDVNINTFGLAAEDILEWNGTSWVNTNRLSTFGFAQLADYNNPVFGPPANGTVLTYNTSNFKWEPKQPTGGVASSSTPHPFALLG